MSRSYKKVPSVGYRSSWAKKQANRKVRRTKDVSNGKQYRKVYCSWEICEGLYICSWNQYWAEQLSDWKRRFECCYGRPRGYYAAWCFWRFRKKDHWSNENPELHKEKHYAYWKKNFKCK